MIPLNARVHIVVVNFKSSSDIPVAREAVNLLWGVIAVRMTVSFLPPLNQRTEGQNKLPPSSDNYATIYGV